MVDVLCILLLKLFIKNDASLNNLNLKDYHDYLVDIGELILKNPKFISNVENFTLSKYNSTKSQPPVSSLSIIFSSIKQLEFDLPINNVLFAKDLAHLIQSQSQLSSIILSLTSSNIVHLIDALKHCSKTLTSIRFNSCNFMEGFSFDGLKYLTNLQSLHFINCLGLNLHIIQPLLDIPSPLRIKSLTINGKVGEITSIQLLFEKIGTFLEYLELSIQDNDVREDLLECITDHCDKIKFLHLDNIITTSVPQLFRLIANLNHCLKYLTIESSNYSHVSTMILKELSQNLPNSLEYLDLNLLFNQNDLQILLNNYKNDGLKKLLIRNRSYNPSRSTLTALKDFVKKKNLDYLSYKINYISSNTRSLEKLIKETQSFVKLVKYEDLALNISDFDI